MARGQTVKKLYTRSEPDLQAPVGYRRASGGARSCYRGFGLQGARIRPADGRRGQKGGRRGPGLPERISAMRHRQRGAPVGRAGRGAYAPGRSCPGGSAPERRVPGSFVTYHTRKCVVLCSVAWPPSPGREDPRCRSRIDPGSRARRDLLLAHAPGAGRFPRHGGRPVAAACGGLTRRFVPEGASHGAREHLSVAGPPSDSPVHFD